MIQISKKCSDDRYRECCVVGYFLKPQTRDLEGSEASLSLKLPQRDFAGRANICNYFEKVTH